MYCCLQVFTYEELELIANLCKKHDVIVFADEVYEWLIYKPNKHIKIGKQSKSVLELFIQHIINVWLLSKSELTVLSSTQYIYMLQFYNCNEIRS